MSDPGATESESDRRNSGERIVQRNENDVRHVVLPLVRHVGFPLVRQVVLPAEIQAELRAFEQELQRHERRREGVEAFVKEMRAFQRIARDSEATFRQLQVNSQGVQQLLLDLPNTNVTKLEQLYRLVVVPSAPKVEESAKAALFVMKMLRSMKQLDELFEQSKMLTEDLLEDFETEMQGFQRHADLNEAAYQNSQGDLDEIEGMLQTACQFLDEIKRFKQSPQKNLSCIRAMSQKVQQYLDGIEPIREQVLRTVGPVHEDTPLIQKHFQDFERDRELASFDLDHNRCLGQGLDQLLQRLSAKTGEDQELLPKLEELIQIFYDEESPEPLLLQTGTVVKDANPLTFDSADTGVRLLDDSESAFDSSEYLWCLAKKEAKSLPGDLMKLVRKEDFVCQITSKKYFFCLVALLGQRKKMLERLSTKTIQMLHYKLACFLGTTNLDSIEAFRSQYGDKDCNIEVLCEFSSLCLESLHLIYQGL